MKAFQMKDDENRIYFRNYERRPGEEELAEVMELLKKAGAKIGEKEEIADIDLYRCVWEDIPFDVIFTGEEAVIYADDKEDVNKLLEVFS